MYEPASLGMFQCRLQRILCDFEVIMFFRKDPPQTEGRRDADPLIKKSTEEVVEPVWEAVQAQAPDGQGFLHPDTFSKRLASAAAHGTATGLTLTHRRGCSTGGAEPASALA